MADEIVIDPSGGNVFADLHFEAPEVELAKARLSGKLAEEIAARGWTQHRATDVLGMDEARVSLLVRGKTGQSRPERLIELPGRLSYDVRIEATPSPALTRTDAGLGVGDRSARALRRRGGHG